MALKVYYVGDPTGIPVAMFNGHPVYDRREGRNEEIGVTENARLVDGFIEVDVRLHTYPADRLYRQLTASLNDYMAEVPDCPLKRIV